MEEANIIKNIAIQAPAVALIGFLLYILIKALLKRMDDRDARLDEVTDKFNTVVTNHLHEAKTQNEKMIEMIDRTGKSIDTNTELTRRVLDKF